MRRTVKHVVSMCMCGAILTACTAEQQSQGLGALVGAAGGAATGALAGKGDTKAILAGATAGAVVGWAAVKLTQYHAEQTASAQQAGKTYGYKPSDGVVVKIQGVRAAPEEVSAGQAVQLTTDYSVLAPSQDTGVPVTEIVELWKDNKPLLKLPQTNVTRQPGSWKAAGNFPVPTNAEPGTYVVRTRIEGAAGTYDERETHFVVAG